MANVHQGVLEDSAASPARYVVMGVCGTGKSEIGTRLARKLSYRFLEGDAFHPPANVQKMAAGIPLDDDDRRDWLLALAAEIGIARTESQGLVLSCSALKRSYRDILRQGDPELIFIHLTGERTLIEERMRVRKDHFMPVSLLDSQLRDLQPLDAQERGMAIDIRLPPDAIVECVTRTPRTEIGSLRPDAFDGV